VTVHQLAQKKSKNKVEVNQTLFLDS